MISQGADGIWCCSLSHIHTNAQDTRTCIQNFVFHILSTGCVMTPVIKAGNCLTVVLRYWIRGQLCRHSEATGCKVAEQWNREQGWAHTHKMVSASKGDASIVLCDPCEWHSAHLLPYPPWDSHSLCPLASWNQTLGPCDYSRFSHRGPRQNISSQRHLKINS